MTDRHDDCFICSVVALRISGLRSLQLSFVCVFVSSFHEGHHATVWCSCLSSSHSQVLKRRDKDPAYAAATTATAYTEQLLRQHGTVTFSCLGPFPRVMLADPALIRAVYITHNEVFHKPAYLRRLLPLFGNGLVTANGEDWHKQRRMLTPAFKHAELKVRDEPTDMLMSRPLSLLLLRSKAKNPTVSLQLAQRVNAQGPKQALRPKSVQRWTEPGTCCCRLSANFVTLL